MVAAVPSSTHAPQPPPLKARIAKQVLPRPILRRYQIRKAERNVAAFPSRIVHHSYHGIPLSVWIGDRTGENWYDMDWPDTVLPEFEYLRGTDVLTTGATVFEVGAHHGVIAMMMASLIGETGTVVAVEPAQLSLAALAHNLVLNHLPQIVIVPAAASATDTDLFFDKYGAAVSPDRVGAERVPAVTVDQLSDTYGVPDLLWIDVEGHEEHVLAGAVETLAARPFCCVEVHVGSLLERQKGTIQGVLDRLGDGYDFFVNESPNSREHELVPLGELPDERFSLVAVPIGTRPATPG